MYLDLFDPILYILEGLPLIDGVGKYNAHGSPVVSLSDGFKLFLSCSVPYLQPNFVFSNHDSLDFEVNADGGQVWGHEVVITKFKQHVRLSDSTIPNN